MPRTEQTVEQHLTQSLRRRQKRDKKIMLEDKPEQSKAQLKDKLMQSQRVAIGDSGISAQEIFKARRKEMIKKINSEEHRGSKDERFRDELKRELANAQGRSFGNPRRGGARKGSTKNNRASRMMRGTI